MQRLFETLETTLLDLGLRELHGLQNVFAQTAKEIDQTKTPIQVFEAIQKDHPSAKDLIPDTAKEKPVEGEVLAVGPGARDEKGTLRPLDVKVGDRVLFGKWAGTEVLINGEDRLILKESDILGVLEDDAQVRAKAA